MSLPRTEKPLHWVKKYPSGKRTAQNDIDLIHERLKIAEQHYKEHHGHQS